MLIMILFAGTSFFASHFSSLPMRANSVFSNPAGLGIQPSYEAVFYYHPDTMTTGLAIRYFSAAMKKTDSRYFWEAGFGYKLPGAFSIGYAYRFNDKHHIAGLIGQVSSELSLGYMTRIGNDWHMIGGLSIKPLKDYIIVGGDIEYETVNDSINYYAGIMVQPLTGLRAYFKTDQDFDWGTGLELSLGKLTLSGMYSHADDKISGGAILSNDAYPSFLIKEDRIPELYE